VFRLFNQEPAPKRKWLLGGAATVAIAIPLALGMTGFASQAGTQGAEATNARFPSFETASIKPDTLQTPLVVGRVYPLSRLGTVQLSGGNLSATAIAKLMIMDAYDQFPGSLSTEQVSGGPVWIGTDFYQIDGKVSDPIVNGKWKNLKFPQRWNEAMLMLRSLLIDRFHLRVKHETKVLPIFEVVLAKNGPKITEDKTSERPCRMTGPPGIAPRERGLDVKSCHLSDFLSAIALLPGASSRPLVDKTGLHGRYSFKLHWTPRSPGLPKPAEPSDAPFLIALREQLGLNIVSARAPVNVIVIEHIERPTPD
jgi:bla regulator protein blaR1